MSEITIKKITDLNDRKAIRDFVRIPWAIYHDDPAWIPPLIMERMRHISTSNPYFRHAECRFWIAYRNGIPVGRISTQIDSLYLEHYRNSTGFWGMIEAEDNLETFRILLDTAENWLKSKGMKHAMGPFNLSINQECGLLIKGFNTPPSMMMGHAKPWYASHISQCGYTKSKDLLAYTIDINDKRQSKSNIFKGNRGTHDVRTRSIDMACLSKEMDTIFAIFNDAWSENWGFIPFTREEYQEIGHTMKFIANKDLIRIAEIGDEPAAFIVVLPNINEAIQDLNGRLLPTGWIKLLWRIKNNRIKTGRVLLMGVVKKYRDTIVGAALAYSLFNDIRNILINTEMKRLELSWILEDNMIMRKIIEAIGGKAYKMYRIYAKSL